MGWDTGRPRRAQCDPPTAAKMAAVRAGDDSKFLAVKNKLLTTGMPVLYSDLRVCNGLDVQDRAAFDHMHGYVLQNTGFSFNFNPEPIVGSSTATTTTTTGYEHYYLPYFIGASMIMGGKPESLNEKDIAELRKQRLYLFNIHYQSSAKGETIIDEYQYYYHCLGRKLLESAVPYYNMHYLIRLRE